jgi:hypothetical protein
MTTARAGILCFVLQSMLAFTVAGLAVEPAATRCPPVARPGRDGERLDDQPGRGAPDGSKQAFRPENFQLSDLVANLDEGNYFKMPPKAQQFLREVLARGVDFTFRTHERNGVYGYISSDMNPKIYINLSHPPKRIGEAICHELFHYEDFQRFKPITRLSYSGLKSSQTKLFHGQIRDLVNMISHEYVKAGLERLGFERPLTAAMENRLRILEFKMKGVEKAFVSISKQLDKKPGGKFDLGIGNLQSLYQDLMLTVLRDKLLFHGAYTAEMDNLLRRFQAVMDFMQASTSDDPRFKKVYRAVIGSAEGIRAAWTKYRASDKSTGDRYALLRETLGQMYRNVGISFEIVPHAPKAPGLKATSVSFKPGESFLLDGDFTFSNVKVFTPYSAPKGRQGHGKRAASGKARPATAMSAARATPRGSASTSSATWNRAACRTAASPALTIGVWP